MYNPHEIFLMPRPWLRWVLASLLVGLLSASGQPTIQTQPQDQTAPGSVASSCYVVHGEVGDSYLVYRVPDEAS